MQIIEKELNGFGSFGSSWVSIDYNDEIKSQIEYQETK